MDPEDVFDEYEEILCCLQSRMYEWKEEVQMEDCKHLDIIRNDDGWYVCRTCHEELRYNPNTPPVDLAQLYLASENQRKMVTRMKCLSKWLDAYNLPDDILSDFLLFIQKYAELYPERKNLISKENILYHLLRRRGIGRDLKLPKMEKTLKQNAEICGVIIDTFD